MKPLLYLSAIVLSIGLCSCSSDDEPRATLQGEVRLVIPSGLNTIETHFFIERDQRTFIANVLTNTGMTVDDVTQILPQRALLSSRSGIDLDFINQISIRAVSRAEPDRSIEMFYLDFIQFNQDASIDLFPSIADLKTILLDESYDVEFRVMLRNFTPQQIIADFEYELGIYD